MPTVPEQTVPSVLPSELPAPQVSRFAYMAVGQGGEELQRQGMAASGIGNEVSAEATQTLQLANQVRVNDAMNQLREAQQNLTYGDPNDPSTGYLAQQGRAALDRPSGQPLADEYGGKLQSAASSIADGLGTPAQQQMFQQQAQGLITNFQGEVQRHTLQQFHNYALSTQSGALKLAQNSAALGWSNPDTVGTSVQQAEAAVVQTGRLMGMSADEIEANRQQTVSGMYSRVVQSALENNNPDYALLFMNAHKGDMTADDILRVQGQVNRDVDSRVALTATTATTANFQSALQPTGMDRFTNLILQQESGGKGDLLPNGQPLTSAKGAKYGMQVTDATAANPGFGIQPAKSDTPDEYNRVGRQLLGAYVQKYGNVAQAAAAYNAGSGAVDAAIKNAGGAWLTQMPAETQAYVASITRQYDAGAGAPQMPTKLAFVQDAVARLGANPRPEQVQLTQAAAARQFDMLQTSIKEQGEQTLNQAQRALIANNGDFNGLDGNLKTALAQDPENYAKAQTFAAALSKGTTQTDPAAYAKLASHPEAMAALSDAQFTQLRTVLSAADFKHFADERGNILNGKTDNSAGAINTPALNTALNERLANLGINPSPAKTDTDNLARVGEVQKFVRDDIFAQQQELGRKMTPQEIGQRVDELFAKNVNLRGLFGGWSSKPILSMGYSDIPSADRSKLEAAMPNATENDRLYKYQQWVMQHGR